MPQRHDLVERLRPLVRWETGLFVALLVIVFFGTQASDQFLTKGNLFNLCLSIGEVAIMTLPLTLIVITGEIDLSVASILGLASAHARLPRQGRLADVAMLRRRHPARRCRRALQRPR